MGRPKGEPTKVKRLPKPEADMLEDLAEDRGETFVEAHRRWTGKNILRAWRRMKARQHAELGEAGA